MAARYDALRTVRIIGIGIEVAGLVMIGFAANWWVAAGVFLFLCGNNIEQAIVRLKERGWSP